jgi:TonB family protein
MQEAVSTILIDRAREADGISRTVLVSFAVHATLIAFIVLMPANWRRPSLEREATPMMITLGGASGPDTGGMTPIPGRAVQEVAPPQAKPAPQAPPAPKPPEMVLPEPAAKSVPKTPPKPVNKPLEKSASRKPTTGPQIKSGSAPVDTGGAPIPFGGLSSGGGAGTGPFTDYANFCCPEYLNQMSAFIQRNWERDQGAAGRVQMKFTIRRDGIIEDIELEKPSNIAMLDLASQRALVKTRQLPPLPREFTETRLTVHLIFDYQR